MFPSQPHAMGELDPGDDSDPLSQHDPDKTLPGVSGSQSSDVDRLLREVGSRVLPRGESDSDWAKARSSARFEMKCEVGCGGMGEVHSCTDIHLGREVVVKILHAKYLNRPEVMARFSEEIRITGQLEHPGVVPIHDAGIMPDGRPFFVMQRVWGLTLRSLLDERPEPGESLTRLLKVFEHVTETIAYAHAQRVIHRDLTPSNIMVGLFGQVKVMDWGLAKSLDEGGGVGPDPGAAAPEPPPEPGNTHHTQLGSVMGTLAYMPPEQANGETERLDERCDVFGLGAILCEILTGRPPYEAANAGKLLRLARRGDLTDAFVRLEGCRADAYLIALAKSCLAADPADRPRDAGAIVDRLAHYFDLVLRQAEWDLVRFFDLSLDLFGIAGFDGHFRRINENFARVLGHPPAELIANPFMHYVHPDDHLRTVEIMSRLGRGDSVVRFRNRYRDALGQHRWFEWTAKAIPMEDVIFAVARDVTDEVRMAERLEQMERRAAGAPATGAASGHVRAECNQSPTAGANLHFVQFLPPPTV